MYLPIYQGKKKEILADLEQKTALISLIWNQACHIFYDKNKTDCAKTKKEGRTKIVYSIYETTERDILYTCMQSHESKAVKAKHSRPREFLKIELWVSM